MIFFKVTVRMNDYKNGKIIMNHLKRPLFICSASIDCEKVESYFSIMVVIVCWTSSIPVSLASAMFTHLFGT